MVAALHGPVYGAGVGLALACHLRLAAESAKFSVAFIKIGLILDTGVPFFLPRVVGLGRAMEMSMLGEAVSAEEACRIGLVNRVVADEKLEEETAALASRLAAMPTRALGSIKQALYASFESDLDTALERKLWARRSAAVRPTTKKASQLSSRSGSRTSPGARNDEILLLAE